MSTAEKTVAQMKANPLDWRIEDLQVVARRYSIDWRHEGTSHCTFITAGGKTLPVPAKKPIKPIYVRKFLQLLEDQP